MSERRFGKYTVQTSNEDKVLFPGEGITKGDLIDYYERVAEVMLPHLRDRPLTMQRFPDGIEREGFYQRQAPDYFPEWIETVRVDKENGHQNLVVCDGVASLVYLADQACITPHAWLSRRDAPERPDQLILDFDPPEGGDFDDVRTAARKSRELLEEIGLSVFVKTTGSRGLHVVVPLDRSCGFEAVRDLAQDVARILEHRFPEDLTTEQRRAKRRGRLYLDTGRNAPAQTAVAPYAARALPGAPVATPLDWSELRSGGPGPRAYTTRNIARRLGQKDDPWKQMRRHAASATAARKRLRADLEGGP